MHWAAKRTPLPKTGFGPPFVWYVFHTLRWCCSVFPVQKSKTQHTRSSSGGTRKCFLEGALFGTFSSPHTFCTPPLSWLNLVPPINRLKPLDRYRSPSATGSAIGRPYLALSHFHTGRSSHPPHTKPLRKLNRAIVAL